MKQEVITAKVATDTIGTRKARVWQMRLACGHRATRLVEYSLPDGYKPRGMPAKTHMLPHPSNVDCSRCTPETSDRELVYAIVCAVACEVPVPYHPRVFEALRRARMLNYISASLDLDNGKAGEKDRITLKGAEAIGHKICGWEEDLWDMIPKTHPPSTSEKFLCRSSNQDDVKKVAAKILKMPLRIRRIAFRSEIRDIFGVAEVSLPNASDS